ncbi:hypothetical protein MTO96_047524 [Rhipicephalus appendiculatus]
MIRGLLAIALVTTVSSAGMPIFLEPFSDEIIDFINELNTTWKAGRNFGNNVTMQDFEALLGLLDATNDTMPVMEYDLSLELPESFDARDRWPKCTTIGLIRDQSGCGSCWAFGAAESISDRICIHSKGEVNVNISAADLLSCCKSCGYGCEGGYMTVAWQYYQDQGIVTGGLYGTYDGCKPYPFQPCEHGVPGPRPECPMYLPTPECRHRCRQGYERNYAGDKYYAETVYHVHRDQRHIKAEIFKHGPVAAGMDIYPDFANFKSGVYQRVSPESSKIGSHAVKILGWGFEEGVPYWLVANSWNTDWGDNGFFKILRGSNECRIEEIVFAGIPKS